MISEILVPGTFKFKKIILETFLKKHRMLKYVLNTYTGYNDSPWNGCRIPEKAEEFDITTLKKFNSLGIGVFLTLSNDIIKNVNARDENTVLRELNKSALNGVILTNKKLFKHIKNNFNNLKTSFSVSGFETLSLNELNNVKEYDNYCPRYEWVFDERFYMNNDLNKCKVMLNDTCKYDCKFWGEHFKEINRIIRTKEYLKTSLNTRCHRTAECWIMNENNNPDIGWKVDSEKYGYLKGMDFDLHMIKKAQSIGYTKFKLCGRDLSEYDFLHEIHYYIALLLKDKI